MSKETNKLIPDLRFPEFVNKGEWELKKLGDCVDYEQPTEFLVSSTAYDNSYKTPVLTAGKTFILGYTDEVDGIFEDKLPVIIFDDFTTASKYVDFPFKAKSSAMKILFSKNENNIKFIYELIQMICFEVGVHGRHWISVFSNLNIAVPHPNEQQKIASCLSSLDEVIAAQSQKLDLLKDHKKGLMQNLFPQEGEKVPKYRFKEFVNDGKWEQKPLDDICKFVRGPFGGALKKEIFVKDGYAVYEQAHAIYGDFSSFRYYIDNEKFSELKRFSVKSGDLIMSCSGTMGKFSIIPQDYKVGVINQALLKLTVKKGFDSIFVKLTLEAENNQNKLLSQSAGGAIKNVVSVSQIKELELFMPSHKEQQKIASCLSSLDALITAQTEKIEQLKLHKKGLMQGLFPKTNE